MEHESYEVEVKALQLDFDCMPPDLVDAMRTGKEHPQIKRSGPVFQTYLPVKEEVIWAIARAMNDAGVPFGTLQEQVHMIDNAREVRILEQPNQGITQITIKAKHSDDGIVVKQLESSPIHSVEVANIVSKFQLKDKKESAVHKIWHDLHLKVDGKERLVEHDVVVSHGNLLVVETEFDVSDGDIEKAKSVMTDWIISGKLPACFQKDVTKRSDIKSASLAKNGLPDDIKELLGNRTAKTEAVIQDIIEAHKMLW